LSISQCCVLACSSSILADASNSKELDYLVAAGNWEGVVLAATKIKVKVKEGRSEMNRSLDETRIQHRLNILVAVKESGISVKSDPRRNIS